MWRRPGSSKNPGPSTPRPSGVKQLVFRFVNLDKVELRKKLSPVTPPPGDEMVSPTIAVDKVIGYLSS